MNRSPLIDAFIEENTKINLSAIREASDIQIKHINDALEINKIFTFDKDKTLLDIWTGWWFPLLPLAMSNPTIRCTGIDGRRKKIDAINRICTKLSIKNATWVRWRVEEHKTRYDYITARWVTYIDKLLPLFETVSRPWTTIILYKQKSLEEKFDLIEQLKVHYKHLSLRTEYDYKLFPDDISKTIYIIDHK